GGDCRCNRRPYDARTRTRTRRPGNAGAYAAHVDADVWRRADQCPAGYRAPWPVPRLPAADLHTLTLLAGGVALGDVEIQVLEGKAELRRPVALYPGIEQGVADPKGVQRHRHVNLRHVRHLA